MNTKDYKGDTPLNLRVNRYAKEHFHTHIFAEVNIKPRGTRKPNSPSQDDIENKFDWYIPSYIINDDPKRKHPY